MPQAFATPTGGSRVLGDERDAAVGREALRRESCRAAARRVGENADGEASAHAAAEFLGHERVGILRAGGRALLLSISTPTRLW